MRYASRLPFRVILSILGAALAACTATKPGAAPTPRPNTWVVGAWHDSAGKPTAVALGGLEAWIRLRLDSVTLTTDSVARATFHLAVRCYGCVFYFRSSSAVDDDGGLWKVSDMPNPIRQTPDGFGWVVSRFPRELDVVYSVRLARRRPLPSTLALSIQTPGGMDDEDPLTGVEHFYPTWLDTIAFPPVPLQWRAGGAKDPGSTQ